MTAISSRVRVVYLEQLKVFLPIGPFFIQWFRAETGFHPVGDALFIEAGLLQVVNIFVACDGAATQRAIGDGIEQRFLLSRSDACFDQITHAEK